MRYSLRVLWKSPGFTVAAVLTLALAIGANAIVFAVLNSLVLRPLEVPQTESLVMVKRGSDNAAGSRILTILIFASATARSTDWPRTASPSRDSTRGQNPSRTWLYQASGNYFDVLRIQPYLGRFFHASDEHGPNSAPYMVLAYTYWHDHFQDDRNVLGRVVRARTSIRSPLLAWRLGISWHRVVSIPAFWVPMVNQGQVDGVSGLNSRGVRNLLIIEGRLKPGVTSAQATADLNSVAAYLEEAYPKDDDGMSFMLARPGLAGDMLGDRCGRSLPG